MLFICLALLTHEKTISTISIPLPLLKEEQVDKVDLWLRRVLWESELPVGTAEHKTGFEVHRLKGRLVLEDGKNRIIQGVRELFEIFDAPSSTAESEGLSQTGKLVLIGRHVTDYEFEKSLLVAIK